MNHDFSVYRNVSEVEQGHTRSVPWVVDRVRGGASKELIERIRELAVKSERDELKKGLTSICWSGTFKRRADNMLIQHSGLMGIDLDHIPVDEFDAVRERLVADPYTHVLFRSPSGDGLKLAVRIPANERTHRGSFEALMEYYKIDQFDHKNGNLSRACFESYDPDCYYNPDSKMFETVVEERQFDFHVERPIIRLESEDAIIGNLLKWHDRRYPLVDGQRNINMFILASAFNRFGISKVTAKQFLVGAAQEGFDAKEIERVVESAYKNTAEHNSRAFEDRYTVDFIRQRATMGDSPHDISKEVESRIKDQKVRDEAITAIMQQVDGSVFWSKNSKGVVKIHDHKFQAFLHDNGFRKLYLNGGTSYVFVRVECNLVHNTSDKLIKDFTLRYIKRLGDMSVYDKMATATRLFKDDYLSMLEPVEINFAEDAREYGNLYYKNCCVRVYKDRTQVIDYADLGGYIWADQVIARNFSSVVKDGGEFLSFISKVAGPDNDRPDEHAERLMAHRTTIGYLLHGHKDLSNNRAVIYNDSTIDDNPNGGSGKGIVMQALRSIKRVVELDGKTFSFEKGFPYQTVSADTQILVFDDVQRYFYFERLFSVITEGITLEKKNKDAVKIPVQKSPKIVITTNYTIQGDGGSHERRRWEVEMSDYFNVNHTPADEFGHQLFYDWDADEWARFDAFIVGCLSLYLAHNLVSAKWRNLHNRKFAGKTDFDFFEWAADGDKLPVGVRIYKGPKMEEFVGEYTDYGPRGKKALTSKRWVKWLDAYGKHQGLDVKHGQDQNGRFVMFGTKVVEEDPFKYPEEI